MTTWSRTNEANFEEFGYRVKLAPQQWTTATAQGERPGYDLGGQIHLIAEIHNAIRANENFQAYSVDRRATRTRFLPQIIVNGEIIPEHLTTAKAIQSLGLGPDYDVFISFATKEEMTLFKLSFSGGVNVGFQGIN